MAPDIAKVDADRDLNLGLSAWYFSDEVLRWLLHGNSLLLLRRTCSSHLSLLITYLDQFQLAKHCLVSFTSATEHGVRRSPIPSDLFDRETARCDAMPEEQ